MAPITQASDESTHQGLLNSLDLYSIPRPFRNPRWKPPARRNKNVKQILAEVSRREASALPSQLDSGASTPQVPHSEGVVSAGALTPAGSERERDHEHRTIAQAAQRLDRLVLERNQRRERERDGDGGLQAANSVGSGGGGGGGSTTTNGAGAGTAGPQATYTNIESAPSLHPSSQRRYCDITGLPAPYTDPKTRLRYHDAEVFRLIRTMGQSTTEGYLAARGAHTVLK